MRPGAQPGLSNGLLHYSMERVVCVLFCAYEVSPSDARRIGEASTCALCVPHISSWLLTVVQTTQVVIVRLMGSLWLHRVGGSRELSFVPRRGGRGGRGGGDRGGGMRGRSAGNSSAERSRGRGRGSLTGRGGGGRGRGGGGGGSRGSGRGRGASRSRGRSRGRGR